MDGTVEKLIVPPLRRLSSSAFVPGMVEVPVTVKRPGSGGRRFNRPGLPAVVPLVIPCTRGCLGACRPKPGGTYVSLPVVSGLCRLLVADQR